MEIRKICIVGGTGFVGRHLANELTGRRFRTRVLTRRRERHRELLVLPTLELVQANVHSLADLSTQFKGCDAVINLAGILNAWPRPGADFEAVHAALPRKIVEACLNNGISRLLHMSALNAAADAPSVYLRTKAEGERIVHEAAHSGLHVTSFQPSVIFGPDDDFFNRFATLLKMSPFVFPLACPDTEFAPVYVEDVAHAFAKSLTDKSTFGKRYELCGPDRMTLRELVEYTAHHAGLRRKIIGLNDRLSRLQARVLELAPGKPFSTDNYLSMQVPSVCKSNGFAALGITPRGLDTAVPKYLAHRDRGTLYRRLRSRAGRVTG
ncbi:MAG: complex I NDUFA9 subunit family protein [Gammaproteobacteria bacterium]|nr:complex I NDUFA9 subunit family protein [Gammaproteobacteria bacterium]NIR82742.1 complex I NDUFA9 subunit family protein [Gammaproteobacteria bacterium]NIR89606.1 complex I NDUFA9 subunit family protein [Gammaproteobacteria bacterium]NIU03902.1 complex I NDUFA9 subunit family protein [Gammaproteobacteria bacterium]NIV51218.1 NAD(P)H-binding protein [Gammaproteobacteria bacterium]